RLCGRVARRLSGSAIRYCGRHRRRTFRAGSSRLRLRAFGVHRWWELTPTSGTFLNAGPRNFWCHLRANELDVLRQLLVQVERSTDTRRVVEPNVEPNAVGVSTLSPDQYDVVHER